MNGESDELVYKKVTNLLLQKFSPEAIKYHWP